MSQKKETRKRKAKKTGKKSKQLATEEICGTLISNEEDPDIESMPMQRSATNIKSSGSKSKILGSFESIMAPIAEKKQRSKSKG